MALSVENYVQIVISGPYLSSTNVKTVIILRHVNYFGAKEIYIFFYYFFNFNGIFVSTMFSLVIPKSSIALKCHKNELPKN